MIIQKVGFAWQKTSIRTIARIKLFGYELRLNRIQSFIELPIIKATQRQKTSYKLYLQEI